MSRLLYRFARWPPATIPLTVIESGASSASADYHISNEIWMGLSGHDNYIEAGLADSYVPPPNTHSCGYVMDGHPDCEDWVYESGNNGSSTCLRSGCGAYYLFWSDHHLIGGTVYSYNHVVRFLSPTGGNEFVDILWNWAGDNNWDINFTGAYAYRGASGQDDSAGHHPYGVTMGASYMRLPVTPVARTRLPIRWVSGPVPGGPSTGRISAQVTTTLTPVLAEAPTTDPVKATTRGACLTTTARSPLM